MKKTLLLGLIMLLVGSLNAAEWLTDYEAALKQAKAQNKALLLDFTGSDWCGWCKKLKREVFDKPEFKTYAESSLVLVEIDFPRAVYQTDALKAQNQKLMDKFGIEGFPTIILLSAEGKEVGRTGYLPGGAGAYVKHLKELLK